MIIIMFLIMTILRVWVRHCCQVSCPHRLVQPDRCLVHVNAHQRSTTWTVLVQEVGPAPDCQSLTRKQKSEYDDAEMGSVFGSRVA